MANYQNPVKIERELGAYGFCRASVVCSPIYQSVPSIAALIKLWRVVDGMFM
jgi:hypothetical protein